MEGMGTGESKTSLRNHNKQEGNTTLTLITVLSESDPL